MHQLGRPIDGETKQGNERQLTTRGVFAYVALWATIFGVVHILEKYSSLGATGSYPISAGHVTDFVLPVAIGLVFVAIAVAIAFFVGKIRHYRIVAIWSFVAGFLSLFVVFVVVVILASLGLLSLD